MVTKYYLYRKPANPLSITLFRVYDEGDEEDPSIMDEIYQVNKGWSPSTYMYVLFANGELDEEDDVITEDEANKYIAELEQNAK